MPSSSALAHNMYLSFNQGEVIRVHGRDRSGWWDGEIPERDGVHSRRGWFPSNYVRELDREEVREVGDQKAKPLSTPTRILPFSQTRAPC